MSDDRLQGEDPTMVTAADYETYIRPHIASLAAEAKRLREERDRFRAALGLLAELSPPHIMERYRQKLREREGRSDTTAAPSEGQDAAGDDSWSDPKTAA